MDNMEDEHDERLRQEKMEMDRKRREWEEAEFKKKRDRENELFEMEKAMQKAQLEYDDMVGKAKSKANKKARAELKKQAEALKRQKEIHDERADPCTY